MLTSAAARHAIPRWAGIKALAVIAVFAVVGCGSGGGGALATSAAAPSAAASVAIPVPVKTAAAGASVGATGAACALVTVAEATTATGQAMALSGDGGSICTFSATADASVVLAVQVFADRNSMALDLSVEPSSEHLPGLGDDAFWNPTLGTVFVRKGDRAFSVVLPSLANLTGSPAATKAKMVTLATTSLTRF
jgi:hypothetical protein